MASAVIDDPRASRSLESIRSRDRQKWLGEKVRIYRGPMGEVAPLIPDFERRPFSISTSLPGSTQLLYDNKYYDVIVRKPLGANPAIPIGIVSKKYTLVRHREILESLAEAFGHLAIPPDMVTAELTITEYGGRMALRLFLPEKYDLDLGDGDKMALRLECFNSVDRSTRFQILLGWFRFVCSNGLIIGKALIHVDSIHNEGLYFQGISNTIREGLENVGDDVEEFKKWVRTPVKVPALVDWVNGPLREKWGVFNAARAFHIATTGKDGKVKDFPKKALPHQKTIVAERPVPGAMVPANNVFAVSQVLAWLAKERNEVQEQIDRAQDIRDLMEHLLKRSPTNPV